MRRLVTVSLVIPLVLAAVARGQDSLFRQTNLRDLERNGGRLYLAGIVGSSFATLSSPGNPAANEPLFTSGGAAGIAFAWLDRAWRVEVEGRARDRIGDTVSLDDAGSTCTLAGTGGWSTTLNLWRDYDVTDALTCYLGGGIGGGGYQFGVDREFPIQDATVTGLGTVGGFAWQVGGGLALRLSRSVTFDLGYRFFEIGAGNVTAQMSQSGIPIDTTTFSSSFSASELFFAIRFYEPFRRWR